MPFVQAYLYTNTVYSVYESVWTVAQSLLSTGCCSQEGPVSVSLWLQCFLWPDTCYTTRITTSPKACCAKFPLYQNTVQLGHLLRVESDHCQRRETKHHLNNPLAREETKYIIILRKRLDVEKPRHFSTEGLELRSGSSLGKKMVFLSFSFL